MPMNLTLIYRGPLASCNYTCAYCPQAKHPETAAERQADAEALARFVAWVEGYAGGRLRLFFTPWGEALIHRRYQEALVALSHVPHVEKVAIQTNLSGPLDWVARAERRTLALWATYHPAQVTQARFLAQCGALDAHGVRYSVGVVGMQEHFAAIEALRAVMRVEVYLWINAYKHGENYYSEEDIQRLTAIDPLFPLNTVRHPSRGRACRCGESVLSVSGDGTLRRCHFVKEAVGNLYAPGWEANLEYTPCPNETCGCHIGYIHMPALGLYEIFGDGVLERIPAGWES